MASLARASSAAASAASCSGRGGCTRGECTSGRRRERLWTCIAPITAQPSRADRPAGGCCPLLTSPFLPISLAALAAFSAACSALFQKSMAGAAGREPAASSGRGERAAAGGGGGGGRHCAVRRPWSRSIEIAMQPLPVTLHLLKRRQAARRRGPVSARLSRLAGTARDSRDRTSAAACAQRSIRALVSCCPACPANRAALISSRPRPACSLAHTSSVSHRPCTRPACLSAIAPRSTAQLPPARTLAAQLVRPASEQPSSTAVQRPGVRQAVGRLRAAGGGDRDGASTAVTSERERLSGSRCVECMLHASSTPVACL